MRISHEPCDNCGHDRTYHAPGRVNACQHLPSAAVTRMTGLLRCDCDGFRNAEREGEHGMTEHYEIISDEALEYEQALAAITAQRDALLAALEAVMGATGWSVKSYKSDSPEAQAARAAIAAAKGDT